MKLVEDLCHEAKLAKFDKKNGIVFENNKAAYYTNSSEPEDTDDSLFLEEGVPLSYIEPLTEIGNKLNEYRDMDYYELVVFMDELVKNAKTPRIDANKLRAYWEKQKGKNIDPISAAKIMGYEGPDLDRLKKVLAKTK